MPASAQCVDVGRMQQSSASPEHAVVVSAFAFVVFPPYSIQSGATLEGLEGFGTPGEQVSLAFGMHAEEPVTVEVTSSSLSGSSGVIPDTAIELHVVHVWKQAGVGVYQSTSMTVPELLVKDDPLEFRDSYGNRCGHWRHPFRHGRYYVPPIVRRHGPPRFSLGRAMTKQLWVTVQIPSSAMPGFYEGSVRVTGVDAKRSAELPVRLEVLPLRLSEAKHDLLLWYKGTLDCRFPQHYVSEPTFKAQLRDIYDHGFRGISLNERDPRLLRRALAIARDVGFRGNVILTAPYAEGISREEFGGLTPLYYVSDELDARGPTAVSQHVANWRAARQATGRTMASLLRHSSSRRFHDVGDIGHAPDVVSLYVPNNLQYFADGMLRPHEDRGQIYYYWPSHMEKPLTHRVLAGVYLWRSGAAGIAPYCYQHLPQYPNSPFDDFDQWEPDFHVGADRRPFKDHMSTYRARDGSIGTLQWKGVSDGITDLRYLTTLEATLTAAAESSSAEVRRSVAAVRERTDNFLARISLKTIDILSDDGLEPYADIASGEYQRFREQVARDTIALRAEAKLDSPGARA